MKKLTKIVLLVVVLVMSLVLSTACETLKNHEHKPAAEWSSDGANHYHKCTFEGCEEKLDSVAHTGGTATCQAKAKCSVCAIEYGELGEHVYNLGYATEEFLKTPANHTEKAVYYKSCACGAKGTETFQAGDTVAHVYDKEVVHADYFKSEATHTSPALYYKSCECGAKGTETFTSGEAIAHTYDQEVVDADYLVSAADCTNVAVYNKSCECGAKGTETFTSGEALGHNWVEDEANSSAATWTTAGVYAEKCDRTGCTETKTTPIEALGRTLVISNADDVVASWDVKKYDNGWVTTSATATNVEKGNIDGTNATNFKLWHNSIAFRFGTGYDAQGKEYNLLVADIKGDGKAMVKIRLRNSQSGMYATYTMPVALVAGWNHYELSLADADWKIALSGGEVTFEQAIASHGATLGVSKVSEIVKLFDIVEFIFNTSTSNGQEAAIRVDNLAIKNVETPATAISSLEVGTKLSLDFSDGTKGNPYVNANWVAEQYVSDWAVKTGKMNARDVVGANGQTTLGVNFVADNGMTNRFTYSRGYSFGLVNYFCIELGNYFDSTSSAISVKISVIDTKGNTHYLLGDASTFYSFAHTSSKTLIKLEKTLDTAIEVQSVRIVTKGVGETNYLYADNLLMSYVVAQ